MFSQRLDDSEKLLPMSSSRNILIRLLSAVRGSWHRRKSGGDTRESRGHEITRSAWRGQVWRPLGVAHVG